MRRLSVQTLLIPLVVLAVGAARPATETRPIAGTSSSERAACRRESTVDGLPKDRVVIVADAVVGVRPGLYAIRAISDDGILVWMDDRRNIDHWTPRESAIDTIPVSGGKRRCNVESCEIGGFAELRFEILRR